MISVIIPSTNLTAIRNIEGFVSLINFFTERKITLTIQPKGAHILSSFVDMDTLDTVNLRYVDWVKSNFDAFISLGDTDVSMEFFVSIAGTDGQSRQTLPIFHELDKLIIHGYCFSENPKYQK